MEELFNKTCEPCKSGAIRLTKDEIGHLLERVPGWSVLEFEAIPRLKKEYFFKNFKQAIGFTNKIGELAEQEGHHPLLQTEWGKVTVSWWTHSIKGLHKNDFVMAAKSDVLFSGEQ